MDLQKEKKREKIKTFVIDTNVFIHKPDAILSFRDNEVVVPLWVLEELDKLKTYSDERGRNARHAIRMLDELGRHGDLSKGVKMENGSILRVVLSNFKEIPYEFKRDNPDNNILFTAYALKRAGKRVFFVSKDINARIKATVLGIKAVDYERQKVNIVDLYKGFRVINVSHETVQQLKLSGEISWNEQLYPNEFAFLEEKSSEQPIIARYNRERGTLVYMNNEERVIAGITALNEKQQIALELLLDDSVSIVTLVGKAGTGKTLLAIATGLHKVIEEKKYSRVLVGRPVIPMGKDIGYLPGNKAEKLSNWMQPIFDNLEYILSVYKKSNNKTVEQLMDNRLIEIEALTFMRGRSLPGQFIIIDEAQNLSPHEIKTIVSRAGENTKIVLTGDPFQIDSPYLDSNSNGLSFLVETFKGQEIFGNIILDKSERSKLAELAAELL
ncbi:MAG: PhoH family protein [Spirochaetes bacterium]|nr:MAG: PhoH family protein [Spirochaetota bacterium]